jgi:hypothetical protein
MPYSIPQNPMEHDCIPSDFTDGVHLVLMTLYRSISSKGILFRIDRGARSVFLTL